MEQFKDFEFDGKKYQVGKLPAKTAMWIVTQFFTKFAPANIEKGLDIKNLPDNRQAMSEDEFSSLVDYCLMACRRYDKVGDTDIPMPVMPQKGRWALKELEYDFAAVTALVINALAFNIKSFFEGGVLKELAKTFQDLRLFNTQP